MKILFVWGAAEWAIHDVARGYRNALAALGHEIRDFKLYNRIKYHGAALDALGRSEDVALLSRVATEGISTEVLQFDPDLVVITSGLSFHPNGLWLLRKLNVPTAVIFTESPYDDAKQTEFLRAYPEALYFTNERTSARDRGWHYLAHAYDPAIHYPREPVTDSEDTCDVLVLGTGWGDRQQFLERVDWTGINLHIYGMWPELNESSSLHAHYTPGCIDNDLVPDIYANAKIVINHHRKHSTAESMGPRTLELAACGAFQVADPRAELVETFSTTIPTYSTSSDLESLVRFYLGCSYERERLTRMARTRVAPHTFEVRAHDFMDAVARYYDLPSLSISERSA